MDRSGSITKSTIDQKRFVTLYPDGWRMARFITLVVLGSLVALVLVGCSVGSDEAASEAQGPQQGVPIQVVQGAEGSVLVYAQIRIQNQGPYTFVVDTGASRSVVAPSIAQNLGLREYDADQQLTGVTGTTQVNLVDIEAWSLSDITLPSSTIISLELPELSGNSGLSELLGREQIPQPQGLLGSDVLSEFGAITIDYQEETLLLRSDRPVTPEP